MSTTEARRTAVGLIRRGVAVIPVPAGEKNPGRTGWEAMRISADEVPEYWTNGQNVGLLCGEPSGWRVDVDLDADEAVKVAGRFLPPTLTSGRESRPHSHWWYVAVGAESRDWKDTDGKKLVEERSTGRQTIVAPSTGPDGDRYVWHSETGLQMAEVSAGELKECCRKLATAVLIARHVPPEGSRHDYAMALAGFLLRPGRMDRELVAKSLKAAWHAAGAGTREALRIWRGSSGIPRLVSRPESLLPAVRRWRRRRRGSSDVCASGGDGSGARRSGISRKRKRSAATRQTGSSATPSNISGLRQGPCLWTSMAHRTPGRTESPCPSRAAATRGSGA